VTCLRSARALNCGAEGFAGLTAGALGRNAQPASLEQEIIVGELGIIVGREKRRRIDFVDVDARQ
jgi:hypothetical protein